MISDNYFEVPPFNSVFNFFENRTREKDYQKKFKDRTIDIEIQRIHIGDKAGAK